MVHEVQLAYNAFGQVVSSWQAHGGSVNASTTPKVQYAYADGSAGTIRPETLVYPDGREIGYDYGSSGDIDDAASRVRDLEDDGSFLVRYGYLGLGTPVEVQYPLRPGPGGASRQMKYTLVGTSGSNDPDTGDQYKGLDRFGRVKDSRWIQYDNGTPDDLDRIKYGYDRASNRIWRENVVANDLNQSFDELYAHDGLHRLKDMQRGTLNSGHSALNSTTFAQCWTLDATGNWKGFRQDDDGDGTWDLAQQRTANGVNEITGVTETTGPSWATPGYEAAGNMASVPMPADPTTSYTATYDAWNRLVKLEEEVSGSSSSSSGGGSGLQTVQENQYDARRYRTVRKDYSGGVLDETRHFYYTEQWQSIEERLGSATTPDRQHVWGLRYIDDLVLRERDTDGNGTLDESLYALQDANWNVTGVVSTIYDALERYAYTSYGEPAVLDDGFAARTASDYAWEYRFRCRECDGISGLHHFRGRHYDAGVGRFIGRDPLAYSDGTNLYAAYFVPHAVDPFGMDCWPGGGWNPLNWYRGLMTGDFSAPDRVYKAALEGAGESYTQTSGNAHHSLDILSDWDPTPLSGWTNDALIGLEGPALNNVVMQNANPVLGQAAQASEAASNTIGILKTLKDLKRGRLGAVSGNNNNEGIYQFPDQTVGGKPYVGQSANMPQRLNRHEASGRLKRGTETTTPVSGGKAAREVAERECIQDLTGGQKAKNSANVANQRDPIGPNRRPGLGLPEPRN